VRLETCLRAWIDAELDELIGRRGWKTPLKDLGGGGKSERNENRVNPASDGAHKTKERS
jgi:hypothetical protein